MTQTKKVDPLNPTTSRVDKWVEKYILIRDKLRELEAEYKEKCKPFLEVQNLLEARMLEFLDQTGQTSAKTLNGMLIASTRHTATLSDPEAFMDYVVQAERYELLDRKANTTAVREYVKENKALPPGCNLSSFKRVSVQRPRS